MSRGGRASTAGWTNRFGRGIAPKLRSDNRFGQRGRRSEKKGGGVPSSSQNRYGGNAYRVKDCGEPPFRRWADPPARASHRGVTGTGFGNRPVPQGRN